MILSCNSCGKKFVVPDNAITESGRIVQCGACGNKWKQFPVKITEKKKVISKTVAKKNITKPVSLKKPISPKKPKSTKRKVPKKNKRNKFIFSRISCKKTWYQNKRFRNKSFKRINS